MQTLLKEVYDSIINGDQHAAAAKVTEALNTGIDAVGLLQEGMIAAMAEVGRLFEAGEYYVPEMLIAARAMQAGLAVIKPILIQGNYQPAGKVAIGTVKGDLHDIGKNLVAIMLEGAGFEVHDLGTDVPPEIFVAAAEAADIIAISALLTTTMVNMKAVIENLQQAGKRDKVKVMIGGAPITETYAQQIGADGYASDASRAVALARSLLT
jgi:5-methyltetrahydrofolate--homocysteine methyltransferase